MFSNKLKAYAPEIILLGTAGFLQFYRLGIGEIQSWDESLSLIRVQAIEKFGCWLDQTPYAVGGLYSASHPPLIIWMMTIGRIFFRHGVFASRIVPAVCAVTAIFFFYKLSRKFFSRESSLFATLSLAAAQHFLWYSHHAQLDVPLFAFITAAVYYAISACIEERSSLAFIAGILFGCALLVKALEGLYLAPFLLLLPYIFQNKKIAGKILIIFLIAFLVAAPWYLYMGIMHPDFYSHLTSSLSSLQGGNYALQSKSWWYYLNQIIINLPFLGIIFVGLKKSTPPRRLFYAISLWFLLLLILLFLFQTQMVHFLLILLLPGILLIAYGAEGFLESIPNRKKMIYTAILLFIPLVWSASERMRGYFHIQNAPSFSIDIIALIIIIIFFFLGVYYVSKYCRTNSTGLLFIASLAILAMQYYRWSSWKNETFTDGAEKAAQTLLQLPDVHSLSAYYFDYPHESYLPQFNYYSQGWLLGWDKNRSGMTKTWNEIDSLISVNTIPKTDAALLYIPWTPFSEPSEAEKARIIRIDSGLTKVYQSSLRSKKYYLYWGLRSSQ